MQPRFAALLFALGLADLAYVNIGLGRELFPDVEAPAARFEVPRSHAPAGPVLDDAPKEPAPKPSPPPAPLPEPVTHNDVPNAPRPANEPIVAPGASPELEVAPARDTPQAAPHAGVAGLADPQPIPPSRLTGSQPLEPRPLEPKRAGSELPASKPPESKLTVTFPDTASAWLTGRAREEVLALAAHLRAHPELRIDIIGHADARGTREFNLDLGGRRARAVTDLLARAGVAREQLEMQTRGEDEPRVVGTSERVWAANRRVEISIGTGRNETP